MKQYNKNKPIKWNFKYWNRCDRETVKILSIKVVPRMKIEKRIEFRLECGTRLISSPGRHLFSRVL